MTDNEVDFKTDRLPSPLENFAQLSLNKEKGETLNSKNK
jgi:hypothetical protein